MAANPMLHVVYCGRGDALMLEYTQNGTRQLILIDGGPMNKMAQDSAPAPYWKYYLSAARRVWESMHPNGVVPLFKPAAIINSHADEDHYGGLLRMLQNSWLSANPSMEFDGPLQMPAYRKPNKTGPDTKKRKRSTATAVGQGPNVAYEYMQDLLVKHKKFEEGRGFQVAGLGASYPPNEDIAFFANTSIRVPLAAMKPKEATDFNPTSIIMQTTLKLTDTKEMCFTGDSNARQITTSVQGQQYSLYKIQHHGSQLDTDSVKIPKEIPLAIQREIRMYIICQIGEDPTYMPPAYVPYNAKLEGLRYIYDSLLLPEINESLTKAQKPIITVGSPAAQNFVSGLERRFETYIAMADDPLKQVKRLAQSDVNAPYPSGLDPDSIMKKVEDTMDGMFENAFAAHAGSFFVSTTIRPNTPSLHFSKLKWWEEWLGGAHLTRWLYRKRFVNSIAAFFQTFTAEAYVVSANGTHNHPNPATIVGLATAIKARSPTSGQLIPVYMTFGFAQDSTDIASLAMQCDVQIDQFLELHILKNDNFMTLDGGSKPATRDVRNTTIVLDTNQNADTYTKLKQTLESDPTILKIPDLANLASRKWTIQPNIPNSDIYFQLNSTGDPEIISSTVTITSTLVEGWMTGYGTLNELTITQDIGGNPVSLRATVGPIQSNNDRSRQLFFMSGTVQKTFYYKDKAKPDIQTESVQILANSAVPIEYVRFDFLQFPRVPQAFFMEPPPISQTLQAFCAMADIDFDAGGSVSGAVNAVCGETAMQALQFSMLYQKPFLDVVVDQGMSTVQSTSEDGAIVVQNATIIATSPVSTLVTLNNQPLPISSAIMQITYTTDDILSAELIVTSSDGVSISATRTAANVPRPSSFRNVLSMMGVNAADMDTMCVPKLLAQLLRDEEKVVKMFFQNLPTLFITAGIAGLKPDFQRSTIKTRTTVSGELYVEAADIVCIIGNSSAWQQMPFIQDLNISIQSCHFIVQNASSPVEQVGFEATATFQNSSAEALTLTLSAELQKDFMTDIVVSVSGTDSIGDLSKQLPGSPDFSNLQVPFTQGNSLLSALKTSSVGFSITQFTAAQSNYSLSSVFARTVLSDWTAFLPEGFPSAVEAATASIQIMRPLNSQLRAVAVDVHFTLSASDSLLELVFHAEPLGNPGDYEYRLSADASNTGLSLVDVTDAIKLGDMSSQIVNAVPVLGNILAAVHVQHVSVAVQKAASQWAFADWSMSFSIDNLEIVANTVSLSRAAIELSCSNGYYNCTMLASLLLSLPQQQLLAVEFRAPINDIPGVLKIDSPGGVSAANLMSIFGLPNLNSVPVLGTILNVGLVTASLTIGSVPTAPTAWKCLGAYCEFEIDNLSIGVLDLCYLEVAVEFHTVDDPLGCGHEQTIFSITAAFFDNSLSVSISYDSLSDDIAAILIPIASNTVTVSKMLATILPVSVQNFLNPLIGGLEMVRAELVINADSQAAITSFHLELSDSSTIFMKNLTLKSLTVDYQAAVTLPAPLPARLTVTGVAGKNSTMCEVIISCIEGSGSDAGTVAIAVTPYQEGSLTLSGLLQLFDFQTPSYDQPVEAPDFLDIEIINIQGIVKLANSSASSLSLQSFKAAARSTNSLIVFGDTATPGNSVILDQLTLNIQYNGLKDLLTGSISAHLKVATVDIWCQYSKDSAGEKFTGTLLIEDSLGLDFESLASAAKVPAPMYSIPLDPFPTHLKLVQLNAAFVRGKSVEISGTGSMTWGFECCGISLNSTYLGALVRITHTDISTPNVYELFVTGQLQFSGFTSTNMQLNIASGKPVLLQASLVKVPSNENQLVEMANEVDTSSSFNDLWPTATNSLTFDARKSLWLSADLTNKVLVVVGTMSNAGNALFLAKSKSPKAGFEYFFSMSASNLGTLWPSLDDDGFSSFSLEQICIEVVSYSGTIKDLQDDIDNLFPLVPADKMTIQEGTTPLTTLPPTQALQPGAWLFAVIKTGNHNTGVSPMDDALALAADPAKPATITLYALVTRDPTQRKYSIKIQNLSLLGDSMLLEGSGSFMSSTRTIAVTANLTVTGITSSPLNFMVDLVIQPNSTAFSISKTTSSATQTITSSDMFNVKMSALQFDVSITRNKDVVTRIYSLKGAVSFGSDTNTTNSVQGRIMFVNGKPAVISVVWNTQLGIIDLFEKVIEPGSSEAGAWPTGYDPIILQNADLYYVAGTTDMVIDTVDYRAGYHLSADLSIFGKAFGVSIDIPSDRSGIVLSGSYLGNGGVIDLDFVKFTAYKSVKDGVETGGPTVLIDTTSKDKSTYQIETGLTLFDQSNFYLSLSYDTGSKALLGTAGYNGEVLGVHNPQVKVQYKDGNFTIVNWPLLKIGEELLDLAKAIEDASSADKSPCGQIVGLAFKQVINNKFGLTVNMGKAENSVVDNPSVTVNISGTYGVIVEGFNDGNPLITVDLPALSVTIYGPFTLDGLGNSLGTTIKTNAARIATVILDNPDKFGQLMAVAAAENLSEVALSSLICRKVNPDNVEKQAQEQANADTDSIVTNSTAAGADALAAGGATGIAEAAAGIAAAIGSLATAKGVLDTFDDSSNVRNRLSNADPSRSGALQSAEQRARESYRTAQENLLQAQASICNSLVLDSNIPATFSDPTETADDTVTVNWSQALPKKQGYDYGDYKNFTWECVFSLTELAGDPTGNTTQVAVTYATSKSAEYTFAPCVFVYIRGTYNGDKTTFVASSWTKVVASHRPWLYAPESVNLQSATDGVSIQITVTTSKPVVGQCQAIMRLSDSTSQEQLLMLASVTAESSTVISASVDQLPLSTRTVSALAGYIPTDASTQHGSARILSGGSLLVEAPPANLVASASGPQIQLAWDQPDNNAHPYAVRILKNQAEVFKTEVQSTALGRFTTTIIPEAGVVSDGEQLTVQVRPQGLPIGTLALAASTTFTPDFPKPPFIRNIDETRYDVDDKLLYLVIGSIKLPATGSQYMVKATWSDGHSSSQLVPGQTLRPDWTILVISDPTIVTPPPKEIQVAIKDPSGYMTPYSVGWEIPPIGKFPIIPPSRISVSVFESSMIVSCSMFNRLPTVYVEISAGSSTCNNTDAMRVAPYTSYTVPEDFYVHSPGDTIWAEIWPETQDGSVGQARRFNVVFPNFDRSGELGQSLLTETLSCAPAPNSTMDMLPSSTDPLKPVFCWTAPNFDVYSPPPLNITQTRSIGNGTGHCIRFIPSSDNSSLLTFTAVDERAQIREFANATSTPGNQISFMEVAGILTNGGGALTFVRRPTGDEYMLDLFIAMADGSLHTAGFTGPSKTQQVANSTPVSIPGTNLSVNVSNSIAAVSLVDGVNEVFWIDVNGLVICSTGMAGSNEYTHTTISNTGAPGTIGSVHAYAYTGIGIRAYWISVAGSVETAFRPWADVSTSSGSDRAAVLSKLPWTTTLVAAAGAADLRSIITTMPPSSAAPLASQQIDIYWYGPDGSIRSASTKSINPLHYFDSPIDSIARLDITSSMWSMWQQVLPGKSTSSSVRALVAYRDTARKYLAWVNSNNLPVVVQWKDTM